MKTATALTHTVALAALFVAHFAFAHDFHGVRRAMRTISEAAVGHSTVVAEAEAAHEWTAG